MKKVTLFLMALVMSANVFAKDVAMKESALFRMVGEVDERMADAYTGFTAAMLKNGEKEVFIMIDSPGGSILDGAVIADTMQHSGLKTICAVNGLAASMAAILLQYCTERYATSKSLIMFHNASGAMQGDFAKMTSRLDALNRYVKLFDIDVAKRMGISLDELNKKSNNEWWMAGGEEALKGKAIDQIVSVVIVPASIPVFSDPLQQLLPKYHRLRSDDLLYDSVNEVSEFLKSIKH